MELAHQSTQGTGEAAPYKQTVKIERAVTVNASPGELYRFWRNLENLPRFMIRLASVRVMNDQYSHWVVKGPGGTKVEWDVEIINEVENELIAWQSTENADVYNAGSVHFHQGVGNRETEVKVVIRYTPPADTLRIVAAKLLGEDPERQVEDELHRFKQLMEADEIPTAGGQPSEGEDGVRAR
jgi:uncharacterized membrane protein